MQAVRAELGFHCATHRQQVFMPWLLQLFSANKLPVAGLFLATLYNIGVVTDLTTEGWWCSTAITIGIQSMEGL